MNSVFSHRTLPSRFINRATTRSVGRSGLSTGDQLKVGPRPYCWMLKSKYASAPSATTAGNTPVALRLAMNSCRTISRTSIRLAVRNFLNSAGSGAVLWAMAAPRPPPINPPVAAVFPNTSGCSGIGMYFATVTLWMPSKRLACPSDVDWVVAQPSANNNGSSATDCLRCFICTLPRVYWRSCGPAPIRGVRGALRLAAAAESRLAPEGGPCSSTGLRKKSKQECGLVDNEQRCERRMKVDYDCLKCGHRFAIEVTQTESLSSLDPGRTDACPTCAQRVGFGPVRCRSCGDAFVIAFPHWHVHCNLAGGDCPACGVRYETPCVC